MEEKDILEAARQRAVWEVMTFGLLDLDENLTKSKVAIITS